MNNDNINRLHKANPYRQGFYELHFELKVSLVTSSFRWITRSLHKDLVSNW